MATRESLIDFADYPHIYCDGLGDVHYVGNNAQLFPFVWRRLDGIFRPVICGLIVRPIATMTPHVEDMIVHALARPPMVEDRMMMNAH